MLSPVLSPLWSSAVIALKLSCPADCRFSSAQWELKPVPGIVEMKRLLRCGTPFLIKRKTPPRPVITSVLSHKTLHFSQLLFFPFFLNPLCLPREAKFLNISFKKLLVTSIALKKIGL